MAEERQRHKLVLMPSGRQGQVERGATLLEAARSLGVEIESLCGGRQTCGKCLVALEEGDFPKHGISSASAHLTPPDEAERACAERDGVDLDALRLACAAHLLGEALVFVPEESQARKQVIRKEASARKIEVSPAVRLLYVEVERPSIGAASDWELLQQAIAGQWGLRNLKLAPFLLPRLQAVLREGDWKASVTVWQEEEIIRIEPGYAEGLYGLAVDVGSTTLAGHLCDLRTGEVLATEAMMNPQVRYGEDLMSRVSYAMMKPGGAARLTHTVITALKTLAQNAAQRAGVRPEEVVDVVLVGNTVMHHLFLGIDPAELGRAPFALAVREALDLNAHELGLTNLGRGAKAHVLPCIAGHVGADNVGVLLAELPDLPESQEGATLIVDIGTNAEILLGNRGRLLSASSPTGPAFEGAQIRHGQRAAPGAIERVRIDMRGGKVRYKVVGDERWNDETGDGPPIRATGICGSGIIEAVGELFAAGLIASSGLFAPGADQRHPAVRYAGKTAELMLAPAVESASGEDIVVTQNDIRQIQLAKGALYAGVRLLMDRLGIERVARIKLAGAFGSYIDPQYAMLIGMIPDCDLKKVESIGNAAGDGARIALLNRQARLLAQQAAEEVEYVETALAPDFQEQFVAAMTFPHASDAFPHLQGLLPPPARNRHRSGARQRNRQGKGR